MIVAGTLTGEIVKRAGFDIGSGSTKVLVADFDLSTNQIVNIYYTDNIPIFFMLDLNRSGTNHFSEQIVQEAISKLREVMQKIQIAFGPMQCCGYGTQAFRKAANGEEVLSRMSKELDFPITVVSQSEEAILGLKATANQSKKDPNDIISFDIGGGSFQLATLIDNTLEFTGGQIGRFSFYHLIQKEIQGKNKGSINPISHEQKEAALAAIKRYFQDIPENMKQKLKDNGGIVEGICAMHGQLRENFPEDNNSYTKEDVIQLLEARIGLSDPQLAHPVPPVDEESFCVSDLIFLLAVMDYYDIQQVNYQRVAGGASGLIASPQYWPSYSSNP